jgi:tRNA 2-thiouridine synthesizing protein A
MSVLDATGLKCPLPVLKAKKALKSVAPGGTLEVHATDPGAPGDFRAFCDATGDTLERADENDRTYVFVIRKAAP